MLHFIWKPDNYSAKQMTGFYRKCNTGLKQFKKGKSTAQLNDQNDAFHVQLTLHSENSNTISFTEIYTILCQYLINMQISQIFNLDCRYTFETKIQLENWLYPVLKKIRGAIEKIFMMSPILVLSQIPAIIFKGVFQGLRQFPATGSTKKWWKMLFIWF